MKIVDFAKDEINQAEQSPMNLENIALVHSNLALAASVLALVERLDRISYPVFANRDGSIQYEIKVSGGNDGK